MILLANILKEIRLKKPNIWLDYNLKSLDKETAEDIFHNYKTTYESEGLDLSVNSAEELQNDYKSIAMIDVNGDKIPDAFIVYKPTECGNKISLLFTDKIPGSNKAAIIKLLQLVNTSGWFIEASKKLEAIMIKSSAPIVRDEDTIKKIIGAKKAKTMKMLDDGYYDRELGAVPGKFITKRIYGIPR